LEDKSIESDQCYLVIDNNHKEKWQNALHECLKEKWKDSYFMENHKNEAVKHLRNYTDKVKLNLMIGLDLVIH